VICSVEEDEQIDNHVAGEEVGEETTTTTTHRAHQDQDRLIPLSLQYELFTQEAVFPSSLRKTSNPDTKSRASLQTC
jgi:hypothetical protein